MSEDIKIRRDPRERAFAALVETYDGEARCQALLETWQANEPLSPLDVGLATELALGVARRRITCEWIASRFYRGRWASIREEMRVLMALGVYQLCWLDRVPDHAAIDQSVKMAKRYGHGTARIVNAVLRQVQSRRREVSERSGETTHARHVVLLDHQRKLNFAEDIFPAVNRKPLQYIETQYGVPPWLVERWHRMLKPQNCYQVCEAMIRRPGLTLRVNPLKTEGQMLMEALAERDLNGQLSQDGGVVFCPPGTSAADVLEIEEGLCQPQDVTSQRPLIDAGLKPGMTVVDWCAGIGTKSIQAAELLKNDGLVIASDVDDGKLARIAPACDRHGVEIIETVPADALAARLRALPSPPDVILVDAPCLNTGVLAKRPEAKFRASQKSLQSIDALQAEILSAALAAAGPQTRVIYATCSIEAEENSGRVKKTLAAHDEWRLESERLTLPDATCDGGYYAVLVRG